MRPGIGRASHGHWKGTLSTWWLLSSLVLLGAGCGTTGASGSPDTSKSPASYTLTVTSATLVSAVAPKPYTGAGFFALAGGTRIDVATDAAVATTKVPALWLEPRDTELQVLNVRPLKPKHWIKSRATTAYRLKPEHFKAGFATDVVVTKAATGDAMQYRLSFVKQMAGGPAKAMVTLQIERSKATAATRK